MISEKELKIYLSYNPNTGNFIWLYNSRRSDLIDKIAGTKDKDSYILIKIKGKQYKAHRLAWLYMTGSWPEKEIDHANKITYDNKWLNLREANDFQQSQNTTKRKDNTSGYRGVCYEKRRNKWMSRIYINGKEKFLGYFNSKEDAFLVYDKAAKEYFGEFYHGK